MPSLGIGHHAGCTIGKSRTHGSRWRRRQMCYRRVCGSTPGDWDSHNAVLALSLRRCRTTAYTSSAVSRFINMLLSPRPFGSRSVVRLGVMSPELRPPLVAIPSVRDTAHAFTSYGSAPSISSPSVTRSVPSRFVGSTEHSPCTALRVRRLPLVQSFRRLGAFAISPYPGVRGFPALRLLRPFRHSSRALVFRESVRPSPYFPSTFASLRELPVFNKQDSNDML